MPNPGAYQETHWRFPIEFLLPDGSAADLRGRVWLARLFDPDGVVAFTWKSSGALSTEGLIDVSGAAQGIITLDATLARHAAVLPGAYTWTLYDITTIADPVYMANGRAFVGVPGVGRTIFIRFTDAGEIGTVLVGPPGPPSDASPARTFDYYVSSSGNDVTNDGSVELPFATVSHVSSLVSGLLSPDNDTWNVHVSGTINEPATLALYSNRFRNFSILGPTPTTTSFAVTAVSGSLGNYIVTATVGSSAGLAVGSVVLLHSATGADEKAEMHNGAWVVTEITDATHIKFRHTSWDARLPTSGVSGTLVKFGAQLNFAGVTAIQANYGSVSNIALKGDEAGSETFGLRVSDDGTVLVSGYVAVNGFRTEGVRADYTTSIDCLSVTKIAVSNVGNNAFMARGAGANVKVTNAIATGCGFRNIGGGGDGYIAQLGGHVFTTGDCLSAGNFGTGFYGRNSASMHCANLSNTRSVCDDYAFRSSESGHLQANDSFAYYSRNAGYFKDVSGSMLAASAVSLGSGSHTFWAKGSGHADWTTFTSIDSGSNGVNVEDGATVECNSGQITNPLHNGIVSSRGGSYVECSGVNIVSVGAGGTPYLARYGGTGLITSRPGMTACNPTIDTVGAHGEFWSSLA